MASGGVQDKQSRRFAIETIFQPAPGSAPQFSRLEPEPDAAGDLRQYLRGGSAPSAVRAKRLRMKKAEMSPALPGSVEHFNGEML